ncbi:hypothetical protein EVAR_64952_1 [Eumeta japonica]|uniref:Uncharacterized protein n=1 Tax=Eumeta variegata TaxID=151549 RepID=A0A4C1ZDP4_EUMVA|nr:hypothetical protein EVAR_64952_1 [Eumeta japonica]
MSAPAAAGPLRLEAVSRPGPRGSRVNRAPRGPRANAPITGLFIAPSTEPSHYYIDHNELQERNIQKGVSRVSPRSELKSASAISDSTATARQKRGVVNLARGT